jgi:nicotinate-nucleotide adenylyltransferase
MVELCFSGKTKIKPSDVEFNLPVPSYSIDTLNHLSETFPLHQFFLIIGSDNAAVFDQWKNHQEILNKYQVLVYPRRNYSIDDAILKYPAMKVLNTPYYDISSTEVRDFLRQGKDVSGFVPPQVLEFIQAKGLYQ